GGPYQSDLRLSELRVLDSSLEDGQSLKIKFDAINSGDINARSVETTLYWSTDNSFDADLDTILQTDAHGTLSAGETDLNERFVVSYDDLEHLGNGYLFAKIDASGEHRESDENNNVTAAVALELVGDPEDADVRMISLSVSQDTIDEGDRIKVFATVDNDGTTEAEEVETFVYWSSDNTLDDQADSLLGVINHQDLKAGEVEIDDLRLNYGDLAPLGDGFLIALAISEGTDTDLGNNTSVALEIDIL
ncbi:MAG: CARDB domain-containing protein, partial [Pseudoprimorskyibacter sp.]|nr:CARDB domain-containing protein [Pseudoprimorskyibacter sp.]